MSEETFELSDDSDGEYEKDRRENIAYNELVMLNTHFQNKPKKDLDVLHRYVHRRHNNVTKFVNREKLMNAIMLVIHIPISLMMRCTKTIFGVFQNCRIEVVGAGLMLYFTVKMMMDTYFILNNQGEGLILENEDDPMNQLTRHYKNLKDLYTTSNGEKAADTPFLWRIQFSTNPIEEALSTCFSVGKVSDSNLSNLINATDFYTLSTSHISGIPAENTIVSTSIHQVSAMLLSQMKFGRVFTVIKNPIHVAVDKYRYLLSVIPQQMANVTFEDYINSAAYADNWMTRSLTGKLSGSAGNVTSLTQDDLESAIEILSRKCLVGIYPHMYEFLSRLENYLQWEFRTAEIQKCQESTVRNAIDEYSKLMYPIKGSDLWRVASKKNIFDMQLFRVAEHIFEEESVLNFKKTKNHL